MGKRIIFILLALFVLQAYKSYCQVLINGPNSANMNDIVNYQADLTYNPCRYGYINLQWTIAGGTIISQNVDPSAGVVYCNVQWNVSPGNPASVKLYGASAPAPPGQPVACLDNPYQLLQTLLVTIGKVIISPESQMAPYYNGNGTPICVSLPGTTISSYQWYSSTSIAGPWSTVSGSSSCLPINNVTGQTFYYCQLTTSAGTFTSPVASVNFRQFAPGSISATSLAPSYNSSLSIQQLPATGGYCSGIYQYSWEQSVEDGPWIQVGTSVNYPSGQTIVGRTAIRRRVTCGIEELVSNTLILNPTYTTGDFENLNYIRETTVTKKGVRTWYEADAQIIGDKFQSTIYLDGFGRSIQTVSKGTSPAAGNTWKDMVQHYEYDAAGRVTKQYLPYPSADNPGKFKTGAAAAQASYIQSFFGEPGTAPTYSQIEYDESPMNRALKATAPGAGWVNKPVTGKDDFNKANEKVHIWTLAYSSTALPVSNSTAVYPDGTLIKKVGEDEKGNKVVTYTDLSGNLILQKAQESATPGLEHTGWISTYYVYDDFGRLRYTITDKAIKWLDANSWNLTQAVADELCYKNVYDKRGRLIIKKQPGVDPAEMVYDERDRLVFSRDATQLSKGQWLVSLYDVLNRPVITGLIDYTGNRQTLQTDVVDAKMATYPTTNTSVPVDVVLFEPPTQTNYSALSSITLLPGFETPTNGEFEATIVSGTNGPDGETTIIEGVAVNKNPLPDGVSLITLSVSYYDNYDIPNVKTFNNTYTLAYTTSTPNVEATVQTNRTTGMLTGSKLRVIDEDGVNSNDKFLYSTAYYDEIGRSIQSLGDNYKGGLDYQVTQYDFSGKLVSSFTSHNPGTGTIYTITSKHEFDKTGRLTAFYKNFNNSFYKQLASFSYDELGQLKTKKLAPGYNGSQLEELTFDYNIQGSLIGINKDYALSDNNYSQWDKYFGIYLGYENRDSKFIAAQYNGNITGLIWRSQGDNASRKYDFTYDRLDRLTGANFLQKKKPSETSWSNAEVDFSTAIAYEDGNGNLQSMTHKGIIPGQNTPVLVDDLRYSYIAVSGVSGLNGNKLRKVDDLGNLGANNGLLGDFKDPNTTDDYTYDLNGNLVKDFNKGIGTSSVNGITYNYMNKPSKIVIEGKSTIEFVYDATGVKLKKKVTYANNSVRQTTYIGDYVYEQFTPAGGGGDGEQLQFVLHEEGRLKIITPQTKAGAFGADLNAGSYGITSWPGGKQGVFEYFIKDHLGSTRMVLTEEFHKEFYLATMESSAAGQEEPLFGQVDNQGQPTSANELQKTRIGAGLHSWPGNSTDVSKLTAVTPGKVLGPNMVLKVMAGDKISSNVKHYFVSNSNSGSASNLLSDVAGSFVSSMVGGDQASAIGKAQQATIAGSLGGSSDMGTFLGHPGSTTTAPKAYLNIVFLDEQFKFIEKDGVTPSIGSNFVRVAEGDAGNANAMLTLEQKAPKNGWAFIFLSNESNEAVLFDDFNVAQEHGRISEESHYYPFGLKIAGISSRAAGKLGNKYGYQGDYAENEEETGYDEFDLRMYDGQIGRWIGVDPYDEFASGYVGMGNDPVNATDPSGGSLLSAGNFMYHAMNTVGGAMIGGIIGALTGNGNKWEDGLRGVGYGAAMGLGGSFVNWDVVGSAFGRAGEWAGEAVNDLFTGGWQNVGLLLAQSKGDGTRSGDDWIRNPDHTGIRIKDMINKSDEELGKIFLTTVRFYTDGVLRDVGNKMVTHFMENTGADFSDKILNNFISASPEFQTSLKDALGLVQNKINQIEGDLSKYTLQRFNTPYFSKWHASNFLEPNGLYTLIGGTQYGDIILDSYKYNRKTKKFNGLITVTVKDDFGVSASDVKKATASNAPLTKGIRAMWILQHKRNYKPFVTVYRRQFTISF